MRVLEEKPNKSKILQKLNLTGLQLVFHGADSFDNVRRYNKYDNEVHRAFCNELKDVDLIEISGQLYRVDRHGYECILKLTPVTK